MLKLLQDWLSGMIGPLPAEWILSIGAECFDISLVGSLYFFAERWRPANPQQRFFKTDFKTEFGYPMVNILLTTPIAVGILVPGVSWLLDAYAPHHLLAPVAASLPFVAQIFLAMLVIDIAVYLEHRYIAHARLWEFHALHHMTPEVSWLTWKRVHPINGITILLVATSVNYVLGFEGQAVVIAGTIAGSLSIWEHSNMAFAWPKPFCYLLVSPRYHRWHHAREPEAVDKNFCLVFPFLDVLGGSYYCPDRLPYAYGVYVAPDATAEEKKAAEIPGNLFGQMLYPFRRRLGSLMRRPETVGIRD